MIWYLIVAAVQDCVIILNENSVWTLHLCCRRDICFNIFLSVLHLCESTSVSTGFFFFFCHDSFWYWRSSIRAEAGNLNHNSNTAGIWVSLQTQLFNFYAPWLVCHCTTKCHITCHPGSYSARGGTKDSKYKQQISEVSVGKRRKQVSHLSSAPNRMKQVVPSWYLGEGAVW